MTDSKPLPDFERPPVIEVVLGLQFDPLSDFVTAHVGLLWDRFRDRFPRTEDKPPLDPIIESFERPTAAAPQFRLQMVDEATPPRVWFKKSDDTQLMQIQRDRLIHNWRKTGEGDVYPRYEKIRAEFGSDLETFRRFIEEHQLGAIRPNQWEVTYINHVEMGAVGVTGGDPQALLAFWSGEHSDSFLPPAEDMRARLRYRITDNDGKPIGRLNVEVHPAVRTADQVPIFIVSLTARGRPIRDDTDGVFNSLDLGREHVVRGFASLTTTHAHEIWGRKDVRK